MMQSVSLHLLHTIILLNLHPHNFCCPIFIFWPSKFDPQRTIIILTAVTFQIVIKMHSCKNMLAKKNKQYENNRAFQTVIKYLINCITGKIVSNLYLQTMPVCEYAIIFCANCFKMECNPSCQLVWLTGDAFFIALIIWDWRAYTILHSSTYEG